MQIFLCRPGRSTRALLGLASSFLLPICPSSESLVRSGQIGPCYTGCVARGPRRGVRISANFWIGIEGIDPRPELRRGNLSGTGVYFEDSQLMGPRGTMDYLVPPGSMQFLHLESEDHKVVVQVMARIIRVSDIDELARGKKVGLAVEFMPATQVGRQNLARLVRHVVELGLQDDQSEVEVTGVGYRGTQNSHQTESPLGSSDRTTLDQLDVEWLTMETTWRAKVGDPIEVFIRRPNAIAGQSALSALAGQVTSVNEIADSFRVDVRITGLAEKPVQESGEISTTFAEMISESYQDFDLPSKDHLSGLLSRIQLPTLLSMIEMEKMTGTLCVRNKDDEAEEISLVIRKGRLIDASSSMRSQHSIRQLLAQVMTWTDGEFRFEVNVIEEDDRRGSGLTELILDLAVAADAKGR